MQGQAGKLYMKGKAVSTGQKEGRKRRGWFHGQLFSGLQLVKV